MVMQMFRILIVSMSRSGWLYSTTVLQVATIGGTWVKGTCDLFVLFLFFPLYYFLHLHVNLQWSQN